LFFIVKLRQTYPRIIKELIKDQRFSKQHPKNRKKAVRATRKLKTIAGRLVRDLQRKLPDDRLGKYLPEIKIFEHVLAQQKNSKNKIYSLHEPDVYCMSKGKDHKKYEFGAKASVVVTKNSGIVVGAVSHAKNVHDSKTLIEAISQTFELRGSCPKVAICDRGYRGKSKVGETRILIPKPPGKKATAYQKQKARERFRRRAGIEPVIGHLKSDYRLIRNYLKEQVGDQVNLMMAATAFNFKKWMREVQNLIFVILSALLKVNKKQISGHST
jgi:IS5 family transposase